MDDDLTNKLQDALDAMPRVPGIDWAMTLSVATLRTLEKRLPGFTEEVRTLLEHSAQVLENSKSDDDRADAPDMRKMIASWVFAKQESSS